MPKAFTDCVDGGGKVRRVKLSNNRYINICFDKDGKSHAGEVKTVKPKEDKKEKSRREIYHEVEEAYEYLRDLNLFDL